MNRMSKAIRSPLVLLVLAACLGVPFASAATHKLGKGQARSEAESKAYDFEQARSWLNSSDVRQCRRRTAVRVDCAVLVTGETERQSFRCRLKVVVRAVYRRFYWDEVAKIVRSRCRSHNLLVLAYVDAQGAIQAEADQFAGQPTTITSLRREDRRTYAGRAEWTRIDPDGCRGCGYDPATDQFFDTAETESCSVELKAIRVQDGSIQLQVEASSCY